MKQTGLWTCHGGYQTARYYAACIA
jgi:hypothetical protein